MIGGGLSRLRRRCAAAWSAIMRPGDPVADVRLPPMPMPLQFAETPEALFGLAGMPAPAAPLWPVPEFGARMKEIAEDLEKNHVLLERWRSEGLEALARELWRRLEADGHPLQGLRQDGGDVAPCSCQWCVQVRKVFELEAYQNECGAELEPTEWRTALRCVRPANHDDAPHRSEHGVMW